MKENNVNTGERYMLRRSLRWMTTAELEERARAVVPEVVLERVVQLREHGEWRFRDGLIALISRFEPAKASA